MSTGVTVLLRCPTSAMASSMAWARSWTSLRRSIRAPPFTVWDWRIRWSTSLRSPGAVSRRAIPFSMSWTRSADSSAYLRMNEDMSMGRLPLEAWSPLGGRGHDP